MLERYIKRAVKEKWALGQFNFSTFDQLKSIVQASSETKSPVILGNSPGEISFFGMEEAFLLCSFYKKKNKKIFLNLDHGIDLKQVKKAIDLGYDMVHFDGSKMEFKENIKETKKVVAYALKKKVLIEGELGSIPGRSVVNQAKALKTKKVVSIQEVKEFSEKTRVDLLALSFGNLHGVYQTKPVIDFSLIKEARETQIPLVFHGGSGTSNQDIKKAINLGVVKVNINTELRSVWAESLRKEIKKSIVPYQVLEKPQKEVILKVKEKIKVLGSQNKV